MAKRFWRIKSGYLLSCVFLLLAAVFALGLLWANYSTLTWLRVVNIDYTVYTNMIWNTGHGHLFKCIVDHSYLSTHLSFTLALLGPLFLIWDHPLLLFLVQWLFLIGGALVLWKTARIHQLSREIAAALVLFFIVNPFTQSVMLSEFHGVSFYFLLIPWLYFSLSHRKGGVWLPFFLILGVREEASLLILPMLVYFSIRDRWKMGVVWSGLAIVYCVFAIKVLFPLLAGMTFVGRRGMPVNFHTLFEISQIMMRARPLLWCLLAVSIFLRKKGWIPILVFPLTALATVAIARQRDIHLLGLHYPAGLIVCVTLGLLESMVRFVRRNEVLRSLNHSGLSLFLCITTLCWHLATGFLPFGNSYVEWFGRSNPVGKEILKAARHIPKEGVLICQKRLAPFCANRADLVTWEMLDGKKFDLVFVYFKAMHKHEGKYRAMIQSGKFGVNYLGHGCAILQKGFPTNKNDEVLKTYFTAESR